MFLNHLSSKFNTGQDMLELELYRDHEGGYWFGSVSKQGQIVKVFGSLSKDLTEAAGMAVRRLNEFTQQQKRAA